MKSEKYLRPKATNNGCRRKFTRQKSGNCRRARMRTYDTDASREIIKDYGHIVKFIAHKLAYHLPASVEVDDLVSVGLIGLMSAAERFDATKGFKFSTFAEFRVRGAMLDELRSQDWVPRGVRQKVREMEAAINGFELEHNREPNNTELSRMMNISEDKVVELRSQKKPGMLVNFDDVNNLSQKDKQTIHQCQDKTVEMDYSPYEFASRQNIRQVMEHVIHEMQAREQKILTMYYFEDKSLKEIGKVLKVTESRVSQLHTRAITNLRTLLNSKKEYKELKELLA